MENRGSWAVSGQAQAARGESYDVPVLPVVESL
jgi:hypothetical protein